MKNFALTIANRLFILTTTLFMVYALTTVILSIF
jgi:hypothetical protein